MSLSAAYERDDPNTDTRRRAPRKDRVVIARRKCASLRAHAVLAPAMRLSVPMIPRPNGPLSRPLHPCVENAPALRPRARFRQAVADQQPLGARPATVTPRPLELVVTATMRT